MNVFRRDDSKPGRAILFVGSVAYAVAAVAVGFLHLVSDSAIATMPFLALVFTPILVPLALVLFAPTIFIVGFVTGTPLVSFTYSVSAMKRNYKGVMAGILLLGALATAAAAAFN